MPLKPGFGKAVGCLVSGLAELSDPTKAASTRHQEYSRSSSGRDRAWLPSLNAKARTYQSFGKVFAYLQAGLATITVVDQLAGEIVEGATGQWIEVSMTGTANPQTSVAPTTTGPLTGAADRVLHEGDGTSWYVDANNVRHPIPNGGTYLCLTAWKGKAVTDVLGRASRRSLRATPPAAVSMRRPTMSCTKLTTRRGTSTPTSCAIRFPMAARSSASSPRATP